MEMMASAYQTLLFNVHPPMVPENSLIAAHYPFSKRS
jgi:hypothetical protein